MSAGTTLKGRTEYDVIKEESNQLHQIAIHTGEEKNIFSNELLDMNKNAKSGQMMRLINNLSGGAKSNDREDEEILLL